MENFKKEEIKKTMFEKWLNKEIVNLGSFATSLMQTYYRADWENRIKLEKAFPEYFLNK